MTLKKYDRGTNPHLRRDFRTVFIHVAGLSELILIKSFPSGHFTGDNDEKQPAYHR